MSLTPHEVHLGGTVRIIAGPATDACGGPPSTVTWAWNDDATYQEVGFERVSGCAPNGTSCTLRAAFLPGAASNQQDRWRELGVSGSSHAGGWGSSDYYALLSDGKLAFNGLVLGKSGKPVTGATIHLKSSHGAHTTKTYRDGRFGFGVRKGTYTASVKVGGKTLRGKYHVKSDVLNVTFDFQRRNVTPPAS